MAQLAPLFSIIGALQQFSTRRAAGDIAKGEAEVAAKQEELAAVQREADRKGRLATALASQRAGAGARGISAFEGSPLTILTEDVRREETATQRDIFQSRLSALTTRARGSLKRRQLRTGATIGLISDIGKIAATSPTGQK